MKLLASWKAISLAFLVSLALAGCSPPATDGQSPVPEGETKATDPAPTTSSEGGMSAAADGEMCGGIAAIQCGEGSYCEIPLGQCLAIADVSGTCMKKPEVCTEEYRPVCGCDGTTYGSLCQAAAAGVSVGTFGECPQKY